MARRLVLEPAPSRRDHLVPRESRIQHLVQLANFVAKFHVREDVGRVIADALDHEGPQLDRVHPGRCHVFRCCPSGLVAGAGFDDARAGAARKQARTRRFRVVQ